MYNLIGHKYKIVDILTIWRILYQSVLVKWSVLSSLSPWVSLEPVSLLQGLKPDSSAPRPWSDNSSLSSLISQPSLPVTREESHNKKNIWDLRLNGSRSRPANCCVPGVTSQLTVKTYLELIKTSALKQILSKNGCGDLFPFCSFPKGNLKKTRIFFFCLFSSP